MSRLQLSAPERKAAYAISCPTKAEVLNLHADILQSNTPNHGLRSPGPVALHMTMCVLRMRKVHGLSGACLTSARVLQVMGMLTAMDGHCARHVVTHKL